MSDRAVTIGIWIALGALVALTQAVALISRRLPGAGEALRRLLRLPGARPVVALAWMWLGWHVFAR
jgi:hypothetical protein